MIRDRIRRRCFTLLGAASLLMVPFAVKARERHPASPSPPRQRPRQAAQPTNTPAQTPIGPLDTAAKYALAIDATTGTTLLDKDSDVPMTPSSMTKLMTIYLVYSALKDGRIKLTDELPVSERAWKMGGSKMFVEVGTRVKVEDLIRGIIVDSGNDACIVLAEALAGSEENFAERMNQKARELSLQQTNFRNATGWPDPEHHMSARDLVTLARRLILDFPEYYHFDSEKTFKYNGIMQENRNPLVQKGTADGLKTGHTEDGGFGLVASSLREGRRVILVVNGLTSSRQRAEESDRLLEWCFREFENISLFQAGEEIDKAAVWLGVAPSVPLVTERAMVLTVPRNWRANIQASVRFDTPVKAPVKRGDRIGTLAITGKGIPDSDTALLAGADIPRLRLLGRAMSVLTRVLIKG